MMSSVIHQTHRVGALGSFISVVSSSGKLEVMDCRGKRRMAYPTGGYVPLMHAAAFWCYLSMHTTYIIPFPCLLQAWA